jgi:hypothetical protein
MLDICRARAQGVFPEVQYSLQHVADVNPKLTDALKAFGGSERRIDLLIGTHYDADRSAMIFFPGDQWCPS